MTLKAKNLLSLVPTLLWLGFLCCWLVVFLIDMVNLGGLGSRIIAETTHQNSAFSYLFNNNQPVEWLQWSALGLSVVVAAQLSGLYHQRDTDFRHFYFLIALFFLILLLEDAANLRDIAANFLLFWIPEVLTNFHRTMVYASYAVFFGIVVGRFGQHVFEWNSQTKFFWIAAGCFALAGIHSVSIHHLERVGDAINTLFFGGRVAIDLLNVPVGVWIMDTLVEESLEFLGAIFFLGWVLRCREAALSEIGVDTQRE